MIKSPSVKDSQTIEELDRMFRYAKNSETRKAWFDKDLQNRKLYRGEQWTEAYLSEFKKLGIEPLVSNSIKTFLNNLSATQIKNARTIAYKPTTNQPRHAIMSSDLTKAIAVVQIQLGFSYIVSLKYLSALIGGLGSSKFGTNPDGSFFFKHIDQREVYLDPDDQSPRYDEGAFVCHSFFTGVTNAVQEWPKYKDNFESLVSNSSSQSQSYFYERAYYDSNSWVSGKSVRITEVYYKKNVDYYETIVTYPENPEPDEIASDVVFKTFDEEFAMEKAKLNNPKGGKAKNNPKGTVEKKLGTQIWKGVYCGDMLLEHGPLADQVPNQKYFPITTVCIQRDYLGIPYGITDDLTSLNLARNYVFTKMVNTIGQTLLITSDPQVNESEVKKRLETAMGMKRGVIYLSDAGNAKLISGTNEIEQMYKTLNTISSDLQFVTQQYEEFRGDRSNAVSGVAKQMSIAQSKRAQTPLSLICEYMLFTEGRLWLDTIQGMGKKIAYAFAVYKSDNNISMVNLDDGLRLISFEVYNDVGSPATMDSEEESALFAQIMAHPQAQLIFSSIDLLKAAGASEYTAEKWSAAFKNTMNELAPKPAEQGQGAPPTQEPTQ